MGIKDMKRKNMIYSKNLKCIGVYVGSFYSQ